MSRKPTVNGTVWLAMVLARLVAMVWTTRFDQRAGAMEMVWVRFVMNVSLSQKSW